MIRISKFLFLLAIVTINASCARKFVEELKKPSVPIADVSKSVVVISKDEVILYEFDKEFSKHYKDKKEFSAYYTNNFKQQLKAKNLFKEVLPLEGKPDIETIFSNDAVDYIISIEDLKIAAFFESSQNNSYAVNLGNSDKKKSSIRTRVKVYDKVSKKAFAEFYVIGESDYSERDYKKIVERATEKSIENTFEYLKTGKNRF
jgi:hypothetical protein